MSHGQNGSADDDLTQPIPLHPSDLRGRIERAEAEQLRQRLDVTAMRAAIGTVDDKTTAVLRGLGTLHTEVENAVDSMQAAEKAMNARGFTRGDIRLLKLFAFAASAALVWMACHMGGVA